MASSAIHLRAMSARAWSSAKVPPTSLWTPANHSSRPPAGGGQLVGVEPVLAVGPAPLVQRQGVADDPGVGHLAGEGLAGLLKLGPPVQPADRLDGVPDPQELDLG